jgi:hypothetical protein
MAVDLDGSATKRLAILQTALPGSGRILASLTQDDSGRSAQRRGDPRCDTGADPGAAGRVVSLAGEDFTSIAIPEAL